MKKDRRGCTISDYPTYNKLLELTEKDGIPILNDNATIFYSRDISFDGEECILCGGNKLIPGVGRYILIPNPTKEGKPIRLCGYCTQHLEEQWGIDLVFD